MPKPTVLHLLAQRPSRTGSGITLEALLREGADDFEQHAVAGIPAVDATPRLEGVAPAHVHPLRFGEPPLAFPVPGMSDVMPYESTVYGAMSDETWEACRKGWAAHLTRVRERVRPDFVHAHHLWLMTAVARDVFEDVPVIGHCHATGLRQMANLPERAGLLRERLRRLDAVCVLHGGDRDRVVRELELDTRRVHVVGAGYRDDLFRSEPLEKGSSGEDAACRLAFVGKFSRAKGLHVLLDAFEALRNEGESRGGSAPLELHVAGAGAGDEGASLRERMERTAGVMIHGMLGQPELAQLLRRCHALALPSFYEGLPLVLVEAAACGCRVVATGLPGVLDPLAPALHDVLEIVPQPPMASVDEPEPSALGGFRAELTDALRRTLARPRVDGLSLEPFRWASVFDRVRDAWALAAALRD